MADIMGTTSPELLEGTVENDFILGDAGDDTLDGLAGDDTLTGMAGDDLYKVDSQGDVVVELPDEGHDTVYAAVTHTLGENVEDLVLTGSDSLDGTGNDLGNLVVGNVADNALAGGLGNDSIYGHFGNDTLDGGAGDDVLYGDFNDSLPAAIVSGNDTVGGNVNEFTAADTLVADNPALNMAQQMLATTPGLSILSAAYTGALSASSLFSAVNFGTTSTAGIALGPGVLLTSGDGTPNLGNTSVSYSQSNGTEGDAVLNGYASAAFQGAGTTHDAAVLDMTFSVAELEGGSLPTRVSVDLMFGSDEYPKFSGTSFVDIAAVEIDGVNYAYFNKNIAQPLSVIDENLSVGNFIDNQGNTLTIEYNGLSAPLRITGKLDTSLSTHTLRIAIADTGDYIYDSGIFLSNLQVADPGVISSGISVIDQPVNDLLLGGEGNDQLLGMAGDDTLDGGSGDDILTGGNGADTFFYAPDADNGHDTLSDFASGDLIQVSGAEFSEAPTAGSGETLGLNQVQVDTGETHTTLYIGTDQTEGADLVITLEGVHAPEQFGVSGTYLYLGSSAPIEKTPIEAQYVNEDEAFALAVDQVFTYDQGIDMLTFSAQLADGSDLPAWLTFDPATATFSGTPGNEDVGALDVTLTASTPYGDGVDSTFSLTVNNVNDAPEVGVAVDPQVAVEGEDFSFSVPEGTFIDVDLDDILTYDITAVGGEALPAWLLFDSESGVLYGTPAEGDTGDIELQITATDASDMTASTIFSLFVENVNVAPVAVDDAGGDLVEDSSTVRTGNVLSNDTDGDANDTQAVIAVDGQTDGVGQTLAGLYGELVLEADGGYSYSLDNTLAAVQALKAGQSVTESFAYTMEDSQGLSSSATLSFNITGANDGPSVAHLIPDNSTAKIGQAFSFQFAANTFHDIDAGDSLTYTATLSEGSTLPSWLHFNADTRTFSGTPTSGSAGTLNIKVTAKDGSNATVTDTFALSVQPGAIVGTSGNDTLNGTAGNDLIQGLAGNDLLDGKAGGDTLEGGAGNDTYLIDNVDDVVTENSGAGTDTVKSTLSYTLGSTLENLTLTGSDKINGTGNNTVNTLTGNETDNQLSGLNGNDNLYGRGGGDTLLGGSGADMLDGGTGADSMAGGSENDTYIVDNANDKVVELSGAGTDTLKASVTIGNLAANVENLTLTGSSALNAGGNTLANTLTGNGAANILLGGGGNDRLLGNGGNDILDGGTGKDTMTGGAGADKFDFSSPLNANTNVDTVLDFKAVDDTFRLDNDVFKAFTSENVTISSGNFWSGETAVKGHDADDRFIYNTATGALYYDADGSGGGAAIKFAVLGLDTHPEITYKDFFIIG